MEQCKFYNGDNCTYEDYASGQTEDGYCKTNGKKKKCKCGSYTEDENEED